MSRGPKAGYVRSLEPVTYPHVDIRGKLNTGKTPEHQRRREHIRGCSACQSRLVRQLHSPHRVFAWIEGRKIYEGDRCGQCDQRTRRVRDGSCWTCHLARRPWANRAHWPMPSQTREGRLARLEQARRKHEIVKVWRSACGAAMATLYGDGRTHLKLAGVCDYSAVEKHERAVVGALRARYPLADEALYHVWEE